MSLVGVPEPGRRPEGTGAPPRPLQSSCTPSRLTSAGGAVCSKDRSLQQGGKGEEHGRGAGSLSSRKKHELGAGILRSCPSSGSAMTLHKTLDLPKPFVPSPGKESFQRIGTKIQTASSGPGSNACPWGFCALLPRLGTAEREAILPRGAPGSASPASAAPRASSRWLGRRSSGLSGALETGD